MINAGTVAAYLTLDTEKFDRGMKSANAQLKALADSELPIGQRLQGVGGALTEMGVTLTKNLTVPLVGAGATAVKFATDYESAFAGVRKTVDATEEEYRELSDGIIDMSKKMPTAATEIAGVMEAAGQLGIEKDSLLSFTETMVMLGDSTNLAAGEAASSLAKFANVTDMSAKDYGRLGSTIVELGNNFATTEADIVGMGTRLASTGNLVGLSQAQIMAVATALSSCGIEAEAGGSAVSKLLKQVDVAVQTFEKSNAVIDKTGYSLRELELLSDQDSKAFKGVAASLGLTSDELTNYMGHAKDLQAFSDVAGVSAEEFVAAWGEDAVAALGLFINGLNDTKRNGRTAVEILDDMGITEVRLSNAVLSLASSNGILTEATEMANDAWAENTALSNEAKQRYATFASQCAILWNQVKALGIELGGELMPVAKDLVETAGNMVHWFSSLDSGSKRMIVNAGLVAASIGPVSTVLGKVTGGVGSLIDTAGGAVSAFKAADNVIEGFGSALVSVVTPAGLVVAGIAALVAGGFALHEATKVSTKGTEALGTAMSGAADYAKDFSNDLHTALGKMSDFASALNGGFDLNDIKSKISEVQSKITKIASTATAERRALTQSEIDKLDEYYKKLRELTEQEFAYYENNLGALQIVIQNDFDMTADNAQKVLSEAQSYKDEALSLAWQAYEEEVALIAKKYDKESEEYKKGIAEAKQHYDERVVIINDSYAEITSTVAGAYAEQNVLDSDFYAKLTQYNSDVEAENQRHNDHIREIQKDFIGDASTMSAALYQENRDHQRNIDALNQSMADSFNSSSQQIVGTLTALLDEMQTNDGLMTEETRGFVEEFLACYDNLPDDLKSTMGDAVEGLRLALESGKPSVEETAKAVAKAVPTIFKAEWEINSPSKVMQEIGGFAIEGMTIGMDEKKAGVLASIGGIMQGLLTKAGAVNFTPVGQNVIGTLMAGLSSRQGAALSLMGNIMTLTKGRAETVNFTPVGQNVLNNVMTGMNNRKNTALTTIGSIMTSAKDRAGTVSFVGVGQNVIGGILSGLNSRKASLMTAAGNIASGISNTLKSALKINSPSKVMIPIGAAITEGVEVGLMKGADSLYETASAVSAETAEALSGISAARVNYQMPVSDYSDKLDRLIEAVERLTEAQATVEIDGRPFGRLVKEYV